MRSKKAIYSIVSNLLLQTSTIIYNFIIPKIIIDHFGSDINGLTVSITQFLGYITLLESGFGPIIKSILYKPIARKDSQTIASILKTSEKFFRKIAVIFIAYVIILCFIFPHLVDKDASALFTISLIIIIAISTFAEYFFGMTYRLFLQAEQKTYVISIIQMATNIACTISIVILAAIGANILMIKAVSGIIFILRPIIQNIYVKKRYNISFDKSTPDYTIKQKWDGLSQHIAAVVHNSTDVIILTMFSTLAEVSVYSMYTLVIAGIKRVIQSFSNGLDSSFGDMIAKNEYKNLKMSFSAYELIYTSICTILFSTTFLLITPFIKLYTSETNDVNYIRPIFGYLMTAAEFVCAIRSPYQNLTLAAGHFRETRKGAWVEAVVNIILSIILVFNFGIIGVAIGTLVAMTIRTVEFIYHSNRHILKRSFRESIGKICISIFITSIAILVACSVPIPAENYTEWLFSAVIIALTISSITMLTYCIIYKKDMRTVISKLSGLLHHNKT